QAGIREKLVKLFVIMKENPAPFREYDLIKLEGSGHSYRIRLSSFRILYEIYWNEKIVRITSIERRSETTYK
ncbi:MAG: type II toxin-antitoxin system RelE/ParE family toxin, partial [Candidatus Micrarchaeota archaeon]